MTTLLEQFADHTVASAQIPYCQIISPPNLVAGKLSKWEKEDGLKEIGFFIKAVEAEKAGFIPDDTWQPYEASLGSGTEVGFITQSPKFAIIHKSQREIQYRPSKDDRYSFVGLAWENGAETPLLATAKADKDHYKVVVRHLVLFLGKDDQPLHTTPIQYTAKGAFAASLYAETKDLYEKVSKTYFTRLKTAGKPYSGGLLSPFALAFVKIHMEIGFQRNHEKESPFCIPTEIKIPTVENIGNSTQVYRKAGNRKIIFTGVPLEDVLLSMSSEAGKVIAQWYSEHISFCKPRKKVQTFEGPVEFSQVLKQNGTGGILALSREGIEFNIPESLVHIAMGGKWEVAGTVDGDTVIVKTAEAFDDGYSPLVKSEFADESTTEDDYGF
jgi:hypothetical protein